MIAFENSIQLVSQRIYSLVPSGDVSAHLQSIEKFRVVVDPQAAMDLDFTCVGSEAASIAERVASGEVLGVVVSGRRVVARGMIQLSGVINLEGHKRFRCLAQNEAFLHFFRTAAEARGQGFYPRLIRFLLCFDGLAGKDVTISCRENNIPSIKGIERAGGRLLFKTKTLGLLGGRIAYTWVREPQPKRTIG